MVVFLRMNFLAHAYLSFNNKEVLVGNMISDFVKGKKQYDYIEGIRKGIVLHRQIDAFTDVHPTTKKAKEVFRADYRLLSGAIVDIIYDHFLATDKKLFSEPTLKSFVQETYSTLEEYTAHLPGRFVFAFGYMRSEDWLYNYQYTDRIDRSLHGIIRRSSFFHDTETVKLLFDRHYSFLQECYSDFIEDVKMFAKEQYTSINN